MGRFQPLLGVLLVGVACGGEDDSTSNVTDAGNDVTSGGASGAGGGTHTGGTIAGDANVGGASGAPEGGVGGNPGVGGGSAGACPTAAPAVGDSCTEGGTCCYGPDEIPFYCGVRSTWEPHPSGRSCCPAVEPVAGSECFVVPYLDCCYGTNGYNCDGTIWDPASATACSG